MSKRNQSYEYKGVLAQPISNRLFLASALIPSDEQLKRRAREDFEAQWMARILALFEDCGVKNPTADVWREVAMALAKRHVPAFRPDAEERRPRGRPRMVSNAFADIQFIGEIDELRETRGLSLRSAAAHLARARKTNKSGDALERRYRRIRARWAAIDALQRTERTKGPPSNAFRSWLVDGSK